MRLPLKLEGFTGHTLEIESAGWFSPARLFIDGQPARKGPKRNQYLVPLDNGAQKVIQLKQVFIDPVPQVLVDGNVVQVVEPLGVLQWIWSALPIVLIFLGGAIGGAVGGAAFWINTRIFRSEMSAIEQYILTGLVSGISYFLYLILGTVFLRLIS